METNNKLRKACIACIKRIDDTLPQTDSAIVLTGLANHIKGTLQDALSTPLRNCDVGTPEEQFKRHSKWCATTRDFSCAATMCRKCFADWAQLPYVEKEGGAE